MSSDAGHPRRRGVSPTDPVDGPRGPVLRRRLATALTFGALALVTAVPVAAQQTERCRVLCAPALRALASLQGPYDLVMLDPPYASLETSEALRQLVALNLIAKGGVVVVEHAWRDGAPATPFGLTLDKTRRYGDTAVSYYTRMASQ